MNSKVHATWRTQNFAWHRAIWTECAELLDHYGWKWWKKQQPDMPQVALEVIDIWHFGLSLLLQSNAPREQIATQIRQSFIRQDEACDNPERENPSETRDLPGCVEAFAAQTLLHPGQFNIKGFCHLMCAAGMSFDDLYRGYVGKNVLNFFRQDHGYKQGTYKKEWQGREDNEHLAELICALNTTEITFKDDLYRALKQRYAQV